MQVRHYWQVSAGVALAGAGVIAVTPITAPPPAVHVPDIALTSGDNATDTPDVVIDIVRHGQREGVAALVVPSPPYPGAPLSDLGEQQAQNVANQLNNILGDDVAGIFSGQGIRDQQTAAPFADMEGIDNQVLPGLNEVDGGIYGAEPHLSLPGILYALTTGSWLLFPLVSMPGSGQDPNGVVFDDQFTTAVNTMYDYATAPEDPVVSDNGEISVVAFNNEASIVAWVLMNVKNPDMSYFGAHGLQAFQELKHPILPVGHYVQIEGNPTDGWTLDSWDGTPIDPTPGLVTDLFVDVRDLITPPQAALWHMVEAITNGDPIMPVIQTGLDNVGEALLQFPGAVINDITEDFSELAAATTPDDVWAALI